MAADLQDALQCSTSSVGGPSPEGDEPAGADEELGVQIAESANAQPERVGSELSNVYTIRTSIAHRVHSTQSAQPPTVELPELERPGDGVASSSGKGRGWGVVRKVVRVQSHRIPAMMARLDGSLNDIQKVVEGTLHALIRPQTHQR